MVEAEWSLLANPFLSDPHNRRMDWTCPECDRRYDTPPEQCVCGGQVVPEGTERDADPLSRFAEHVYNVFFDPERIKRSLVTSEPRIRLAFRVLIGLSVLLFAAVLVSILL